MKKVLIAFTNSEFDPLNEGAAHKMLKEHGFEITQYENPDYPYMPAEEVARLGQDYDAIISLKVPISAGDIKRMAPRLKIIARYGSGYDEVDAKAAAEHGVAVTISKEIEHTNGVAEMALVLMLSALYHIPQNYRECTLNGKWIEEVRNHQLKGRTVGFFAFGAIAQCLAGKLRGAGVRMIAMDKYPDYEAAKKLGVEIVSFDELVKQSDIISIHAPALEENYHIFSTGVFAKMKPGAILINTARGVLVDEKALYDALASGRLGGAAVDVFNNEPVESDNPLFGLENFIGTPHIAGHNFEARHVLCISTAKAVIDCIEGRKPYLLVN
jgi:D-3-phosphoglycerate dehydrogenase